MAVNPDRIREAQAQGITLGVIPEDGSTRPRLEIDEFIQDKDMMNLYILALLELQSRDWTDPYSYFQIAGIHGRPWAAWNDVEPQYVQLPTEDVPQGSQTSRHAGYCEHSSILFPSWHRAYLMMLEQTIYLAMTDVARSFQQEMQPRYLGAVARFRLPFWDPFLPRQKMTNKYGYPLYKCAMPMIFMVPKVRVNTPRSPHDLVYVDNPLYTYNFPPGTGKYDERLPMMWSEMDHPNRNMAIRTIRGMHPGSGASDHTLVINALDNAISHNTGSGLPLGGKMYRILLGPQMSYGEMSNTSYVPSGQQSTTKNVQNSVEGFHNDIHDLVGQGGHMSDPSIAGFDPIFWLHHTNVDRIFAIWQSLNAGTGKDWFIEQRLLGEGTYAIPAGTDERPTDPLVPFIRGYREEKIYWWTGNDLRDWRRLGYDYPQTKMADTGALRKWVNDNYEWATIGGPPPQLNTLWNSENFGAVQCLPEVIKIDGVVPLPPGDQHLTGDAAGTTSDRSFLEKGLRWFRPRSEARYEHLGSLMKAGKMLQWNATISVEKFALGGSFTIFLFLGPFSEDPRTWPRERNMVGSDSIFANGPRAANEGCEHCRIQTERRLLDTDTIPLTTPLVTYWRTEQQVGGLPLKSLDPEDAVPFLKKNLHWRIIGPAGVINPGSVPSLQIQIGSQVVHLPTDATRAPVYENERVWAEVTNGRDGGLQQGARLGVTR